MKRGISFLIVMTLLVGLFPLASAADTKEETDDQEPSFYCATDPDAQRELFYDLLLERLGITPYAQLTDNFRMPSTGEARMLVLPIIFTDSELQDGAENWDQAYEQLKKAYFGDDDGGPLIDQSLRTRYAHYSYGRLNITGDVLPLYFADGTYLECIPHDLAWLKMDEAYELVTKALATYDIDYSQYDANGDGYVDSFVVVLGLGGSNIGGVSMTESRPSKIQINSDTTILRNVVWTLDHGDNSATAVHETAHCMGLDDNYIFDESTQSGNCVIYGIHNDIMGAGYSRYFNAYYSYVLGWTDPIILTGDSQIQEVTLSAVENFDAGPDKGAKSVIYIPNPEDLPFTEFYIAEYRNSSQAHSSSGAKPGITLWHCKTDMGDYGEYKYQNYLQAVCPTGSARYSAADFFVPYGAPWNEYSTSNIIAPDSLPVNTDLYDGTKIGFFMQVLGQDEDQAVLRIGTVDAEKSQQAPLEIVPPETITYGDGPFQISSTGGSGTGAVTYKVILGNALSVTPEGMATIQKAGTAIVTATKAGDDVYADTATNLMITVEPRNIACASVAELPAVTYNGKAHKPVPTVSDEGAVITPQDYDVTYGENINALWGTVTLVGKGNYTGEIQVTFPIERAERTIGSAQELRELAARVNGGDDCISFHFKLTADIDLGGETEPYPAIGDSKPFFQGVLDGNGYKVTGLYIKPLHIRQNQGLIGILGENGVVQNLKVEGTVIGSSGTAGIVGSNYGIVKNCSYTGNISSTYSSAGGVVGLNNSTGVVRNCYSISDIKADTWGTGGVVGINWGTVEDCYHVGTVAGGLVGNNNFEFGKDYVGGVAGLNGTRRTLAPVGTVRNCYHLGSVTGGGSNIGGVIGGQEDIPSYYVDARSGTASDCYYLFGAATGGIDSTDVPSVAEGKTEEEFQMESTFTNWDFENVWVMSDTLGRPILRAIPEVSHTHDYGTAWSSDETDHWHECECGERTDLGIHIEDTGTVTKQPTLEETGTKTYFCSVCGYEMQTEILDKLEPSHEHSFSETWSKDGTGHWHECECGERADEAAHTPMTDPAVAATCTTPGKTEGSHCSTCGYAIKAQVEIPALKHQISDDWHYDNDYGPIGHWHTCKNCKDFFDLENHVEDTGVITKVPTATTPGIKTFTCTMCGWTRTEVIPATGVPVDPTPTPTPTPDPDPTPTAKPSDPTPPPSGGGNTGGGSTPSGPSGSGETVTTPPPETSLPPAEEQPNLVARVETVFSDIPAGKWYTKAVQNVYEKGLMQGVSPTAFSPFSSMSRGMMVTVLHRMDGAPETAPVSFGDVRDGAWYAEGVSWAASNGVVYGYSDGRFGPTDDITREQVAVMLYRYAAYKGFGTAARADLSGYEDLDKVHGYAREAMEWAVAVGLIHGRSTVCLAPRDMASRAEVAQLLSRFMELQAQPTPQG